MEVAAVLASFIDRHLAKREMRRSLQHSSCVLSPTICLFQLTGRQRDLHLSFFKYWALCVLDLKASAPIWPLVPLLSILTMPSVLWYCCSCDSGGPYGVGLYHVCSCEHRRCSNCATETVGDIQYGNDMEDGSALNRNVKIAHNSAS